MASFLDAVRFLPVSNGTADFVVAAATVGYQTPAQAGAVNNAVYRYRAQSSDLSQWEIGYGAYIVGTQTLQRSTILFSSTGGSKVSFSTTPNVAVVLTAEDLRDIHANTAQIGLQTGVLSPTVSTLFVQQSMFLPVTEEVSGYFLATVPVTGASASYQKVSLHGTIGTSDPSNYGSGWLFDAIAVSGFGYITDNNPTGRAWGGTFEVQIDTGSDGNLAAIELGVFNNGSDQSDPDTNTSKQGCVVVPHIGNITAAFWAKGGSTYGLARIHHAFYASTDAIAANGYFLNYVDHLTVAKDGSLEIKNGATNSFKLFSEFSYNTLLFNGGTGFTDGIGFQGGGPADGNLYLLSQAGFPFLNGGGTIATLGGGGDLDLAGTTISTAPVAVNALPTPGTVGRRAFVNNATATTFASIVAGGGGNKVPVYDDGTNWRIG